MSTLATVLAWLAEAKRPLILTGPALGRGPRRAAVQRLVEATGAPALAIESPRGLNDPWLRGAVRVFAEADLVLLLGKPLDFSLRFGQAFARDCRIVAVDVEPTAPDARIALALDADPAGGAARLAEHASLRRWPRSTWREQVESARQASPPEWAECAPLRARAHPSAARVRRARAPRGGGRGAGVRRRRVRPVGAGGARAARAPVQRPRAAPSAARCRWPWPHGWPVPIGRCWR